MIKWEDVPKVMTTEMWLDELENDIECVMTFPLKPSERSIHAVSEFNKWLEEQKKEVTTDQ